MNNSNITMSLRFITPTDTITTTTIITTIKLHIYFFESFT